MMERIAETSPRFKARLAGFFYLLMLPGVIKSGTRGKHIVLDGKSMIGGWALRQEGYVYRPVARRSRPPSGGPC